MMKKSGCINNINLYKKYFDILTTDNENCILFFEELRGMKLHLGDVLMFDVVDTSAYGLCAINVEKVSNVILEELRCKFEKGESFEAFVEEKTKGGFNVRYKGYKCFLPNLESRYKNYNFEGIDVTINKYSSFKVLSIVKDDVFLSCWEYMKEKYIEFNKKEFDSITVGMSLKVKVCNVYRFTLFVKYNYTESFISLKKILENYSILYSKENRKLLDKLLKQVFLKEKELIVTVVEKSNCSYKLDIDWDIETNQLIYKEFMVRINELFKNGC